MALANSKDLSGFLIEKSVLTEDSLAEVRDIVLSKGKSFSEACLDLDVVDEEKLAKILSEFTGRDVVDIKELKVNEDLLSLLPIELMHAHKVTVATVGGDDAIILFDPTDIFTIDKVETILKRKGAEIKKIFICTPSQIDKFLNNVAGAGQILQETAEGFDIASLKISDDDDSVISIEKISEDASPVVRLVDTTIYDALSKHASDIHMESTAEGLMVKYRLDGVLHYATGPVDKTIMASVISRIKIMSDLDISERRVPQDGRFKIRFKGKYIDFRVSIMPSVYGEDAVIRILDKEHITKEFTSLTLDILGFGASELELIRKVIREPYGMVLVTGPTGSGKTTTLYGALSEINVGTDKIITIEDPVEYELSGIVQVPVNEKKGLTFARGLRSILRHDPDKIMVGEIRDVETAQIAIQAALTGHLVFTTVHANNVFDVIGRFVHMGIEPYNFVSSLNVVMAQRLIRLVCEKCRTETTHNEEELSVSNLNAKMLEGHTIYKAVGCSECYDTGYLGRKAIIEILDLNDTIKDLIAERKAPSIIKQQAKDDGLISLRERAVESFLRGETTLEEVNRITFVD